MKLPQLGKQVEKSSNAKIAPSVSVGTASAPHSSISEATPSSCNNDDEFQHDASSQQAPKELQLSHDKADIGSSSNDNYTRDHADVSLPLNQGQKTLELQPASGPRQKEKHLVRQTSSELLLVRGSDEGCEPQQTPGPASGAIGNGHKGDEGPPQTSAQLKAEVVGEIEDTKDRDTQDPSRALVQPSSTADWQAYADVPDGFQVVLKLDPRIVKSDSYYSLQQKIESFLYLILMSKLLTQF